MLFLTCPLLFSQQKDLVRSKTENAGSNASVQGDDRQNGTVDWKNLRSEAKYDRGARLFLVGRYAEAAGAYKSACESSNPKACTDLGVMYNRGIGVKRNYPLAGGLYRKGCDGGNALGCANLGIMHWKNQLPKDDELAVDLFRRACDGGDSGGCLALGFMYENGDGIPKDKGRAAELYRQACGQGNIQSCSQMSLRDERKEPLAALALRDADDKARSQEQAPKAQDSRGFVVRKTNHSPTKLDIR
jgi:TPR repeat protein